MVPSGDGAGSEADVAAAFGLIRVVSADFLEASVPAPAREAWFEFTGSRDGLLASIRFAGDGFKTEVPVLQSIRVNPQTHKRPMISPGRLTFRECSANPAFSEI